MITVGALCVDRVAPTGSFTSPAAGNVAGVVTLAVSAADNDAVASVQFRIDGTNIGAPDTAAPFSINYDTRALLNGAHTFSAIITDRVGNAITVNQAVTFANLPVVTITSPANGGAYPGTWVYSATITHYDSSVTNRFYIDGVLNNTIGGTSPSYTFDSHYLTAGAHTFQVTSTDNHGNVGQQTVTATVANSLPGGGITYLGTRASYFPDDGQYYDMRADIPDRDHWAEPDFIWTGTGNKYSYVYLPSNPDPTHYQMYVQGYVGYAESGAGGVRHYMDMFIDGGGPYATVEMPVGGPFSGNYGPAFAVDGGNGLYFIFYSNSNYANSAFCQSIGGSFWFGLKPGYQS